MSDPKLAKLTERDGFRRKVEAVLTDLRAHGWDPIIASALRTERMQNSLVARGYSKTIRSKHLPGPDGLAQAADIVPRDILWSAPRAYWLQLASSAHAHGLVTGIDWGLPETLRVGVWTAVAKKRWAASVKLGWDPAHVQLGGESARTTRAKKLAFA